MDMTGAQYIIHFLETHGVTIVTGIPGGTVLPLYDALWASGRIRHVLARHEQGAGFIAQGMARLTGRPGVCIATSGPGSTNLLTAIADAHRDSVPLVCLTGQVPQSLLGTDAFQEVDTIALTRSITKGARLVRSTKELEEVLPWAFSLAASGKPGPVVVDVPKDVQCQVFRLASDVDAAHAPETWSSTAEVNTQAWSSTAAANTQARSPVAAAHAQSWSSSPTAHAPAAWDVARAAAMLNASKRPLLCLGGGAVRGRAATLAKQLAQQAGLPVTTTLMGLGVLPADHPLCLGMHGMHGHAQANIALDRCDLLLAVGSRMGDRSTGKPEDFCAGAKIIHVNIDEVEIGRIKQAHVGIAADAALFLEALLPLVERRLRPQWMAEVQTLKAQTLRQTPDASGLHSPQGIIRAVAACLDERAVIVTDVGQHQMWVAQSFPFRRPGRWLTSGGLGVMGFGVPAAIGAALADPKAQVVCFSGDGSIAMNIQELATLADEDVQVKVVVMDNQSLGMVAQQQAMFYESHAASRYARRTDFAAIAQGFGLRGLDLEACANPEAALREELARPGPALIHTRIGRDAMVFPMVAPGAANREMIGHTVKISLRHPTKAGEALPISAIQG